MKLSQVIAIEKDVRAASSTALTKAHHDLQKTAPLSGISRTYQPLADDGETLPSERTLVQFTANEHIQTITEALTKMLDVTFTKEATNASSTARADVVIDGVTVVANATVPYLLFLEKQLADWRTFITKLPVLDPAEKWEWSNNDGCYRSEPIQTARSKKTPKNHVKAEATDKHPAQVEVFYEDIKVGTWTTTKFSGALPQETVTTMLRRLDALSQAVKIAREEANSAAAIDARAGEAVTKYVFEGVLGKSTTEAHI